MAGLTRRNFLMASTAAAIATAANPSFANPTRTTAMTTLTPFKLAIAAADLADLKARLAAARWPTEVDPDSWQRGVPGAYLRRVADRWQALDWRAVEDWLNQYEQVLFEHDGTSLHAFHIRSRHQNATPLVLIHGWPSSGIEYLKLIEPLIDPTAHGGSPADAFHLVIPTQPGFGLSPAPARSGWTSADTAAAIAGLMAALGYDRYGVHGTDMGSDVAGKLDMAAPGKLIGIHLGTDTDTIVAVASFMGGNAAALPGLSAEQQDRVAALFAAIPDRNGYIAIQASRPKTLGYALNDSPIGQLAWILEKFEAWTNPAKATVEDAVDLDQLLVNVSAYWFGGGGAGSANAVWESMHAMGWAPPSATPRGVAAFNADDLARPLMDPQEQIAHWSEFREGGHFPAMEEPTLLAGDLRKFFASVRG